MITLIFCLVVCSYHGARPGQGKSQAEQIRLTELKRQIVLIVQGRLRQLEAVGCSSGKEEEYCSRNLLRVSLRLITHMPGVRLQEVGKE